MLKCQCGLYNHDAKVAFETEVSIEVDSGYFLKIKLLIVGIFSLCVFTVGRVIYPTWIPFQRYHDTLYVVNTPSRITLWTHTLDNLCDTKVVALRTQSESTTDYTYNSKHSYPLKLYYI